MAVNKRRQHTRTAGFGAIRSARLTVWTGRSYTEAMLNAEYIEVRIREGLPGCVVRAVDMTGGGDHWQVLVVHDSFAGKPTLARHRMVYDLFQEELKGPLHALTLRTLTPDQAKEAP